jgi:hypothetical protein
METTILDVLSPVTTVQLTPEGDRSWPMKAFSQLVGVLAALTSDLS